MYHKVANTFRLTKIARELTWTVELVLFNGAYLSRVYISHFCFKVDKLGWWWASEGSKGLL